MQITAADFIARVQAGTSVKGTTITGAVRIGGGPANPQPILETDWSDCTFQSSVEIRGSIEASQLASQVIALDLRNSRIDGDLSLVTVTVILPPNNPGNQSNAANKSNSQFKVGRQPKPISIEMWLDDMEIKGNLSASGLSIVARIGECRLDFHAENTEVTGHVLIDMNAKNYSAGINLEGLSAGRGLIARGGFDKVVANRARVTGDIAILFDPYSYNQSDSCGNSVNRAAICLASVRAEGDVTVSLKDETIRHEINQLMEGEDDVAVLPQRPEILLSLAAERIICGGDLRIGISTSEYLEDCQNIVFEKIDLRRASIREELLINKIDMHGSASYEDNLKKSSALTMNQLEAGTITLSNISVDIAGEAWADPGEYGALVDAVGMRIEKAARIVRIRGTIFQDSASSAASVAMDLSLGRFRSLRIDNIEVGIGESDGTILPLSVVARNIQVQDDASLSHDAQCDLSNANIGHLVLEEPVPQGRFNLLGATIGRWGLKRDIENAEQYLRLLECSTELDISQYVSVEERLENIGRRHDADTVHVKWQRRQRQEQLWAHNKWRWFISWLHDLAMGYGTQRWRPAMALLVMLVISTGLIWKNYDQWIQIPAGKFQEFEDCGVKCASRLAEYQLAESGPGRLRDAASLSLRDLVPLVDFGLAAHLEPVKTSWGDAWLLLLKVIGWVLWPVLLTSLIKGLFPKRHQA